MLCLIDMYVICVYECKLFMLWKLLVDFIVLLYAQWQIQILHMDAAEWIWESLKKKNTATKKN